MQRETGLEGDELQPKDSSERADGYRVEPFPPL
jgi:hypothetical protein